MDDKDIIERNATLDDDSPALSEDEVQERILEDSGMNGFQKAIARMDEQKWTLVQRIGGVVLGIASAVALFWEGLFQAPAEEAQKGFSISLILAVVLAMVAPNIIEKQGLRKAPKLRTTVAITLVVAIVGYAIFMLATGKFSGITTK